MLEERIRIITTGGTFDKLYDEAFEEVERLKEIGYTYGFTKEEVEKQREKYERMLDNIVEDE